MKNSEKILGFIGIILILVLGKTQLTTDILFFRLIVGAGLGYSLSRAYTGFAGSVNRAYKQGSTKLLRTLMFMFFITALLVTAFLFNADATSYNLWVNPINLGLILGGVLFGFGMAFSACCASGVLTDLVTGLPRALITLIFFGFGIFIGFPIQKTASWITDSWFSTTTGAQLAGGVFLPDLFTWDGMGGYLGALAVTGLLCLIVIYFAYMYEKKRKNDGTYTGNMMEKVQDVPDDFDSKDYDGLSAKTYDRLFIKPWTLKQGAVVIAILFALLIGVTKAGWGASTPYGLWFGKALMIFGISAESLADFTKMSPEAFTTPFFQHQVSVQNFGILLGTLVYLLTAGKFLTTFMSEIKITGKEALLYGIGGLTMGFGTRLANGCNVGALYTPIANFSLSGWVFLVVMIIGGVLGNKFAKAYYKK